MRHRRRHRPLVALLGLAPIALAGCEKADPVALAIADVERELAEIHPGGTAAADPGSRESVYRSAISALRAAGQSGTDAQRDAASLLTAIAEEGLSRLASADATALESRLVDLAARLRATADRAVAELALAEALATQTGDSERSELETGLAEGRARVAEAQARRDELTGQREALLLRAEGHAARAAEHSATAGRLRSEALAADPDAVAEIAQRAYEAQRRAAAEDTAASDLRAQAERLDPEIAEQSLVIESVQAEIQALNEALARVDQRVRDAEASAQSARASARSAAQDAEAILDQFEAARTQADELWAQAVTHAQAAIASVGRARGIDRATLALRRGESQQRLGEIMDARARGLSRSVGQLELLAGLDRPLPFAARLDALIGAYEAAADEAAAGAADAFGAAIAAYEGASTRDATVRDRLDRVRALLAGQRPPSDGAPADQAG